MNCLLRVENLNKSFKNTSVVKDVSFTLTSGKIHGLVGPNGAGKSTILRMIVGLIKKDRGKIYINEIDIDENFPKAITNVGCIIEQPDMYEYLSGYNNIKYYSNLVKKKKHDEIIGVLEDAGLKKDYNKKVINYSLGMKQRLGIAQSILHSPKILILDEPTNGLDPEGIIQLRKYLKNLVKSRDMSILISSHILSEIEIICDEISFIKNGVLIKNTDLNETQNFYSYKIKTDNNISCINLLKKNYNYTIEEVKGYIYIKSVENIDIGSLSKFIIKSEIQLLHLSKESRSLEKSFLELMGSNNNE